MSNAKKKRVSLRGSKGTIQRVLKLIQPYRGLVLFTLLLAAVTVLTTLYAPILSGRGVDLIVGQGNVNFPALGKIAIQFGVTVCVTSICQWLMNMVNNRITFQVVRDIRVQAFQHMEILPLSYMDAHKPGDAISRINTDVEQFSDGLLMGFTQLFTGILTKETSHYEVSITPYDNLDKEVLFRFSPRFPSLWQSSLRSIPMICSAYRARPAPS